MPIGLKSVLTQGSDLYFLFSFLKRLTTPFEKTKAYQLGIIDKNGKNLIKKRDFETQEQKDAYTMMDTLIFNLKKLLGKVPGGKSRIASYAAALFLIKEQYNLNDSNVDSICKKIGINKLDIVLESNNWYMLDDGSIAPGIYRIHENKLINKTCCLTQLLLHSICFISLHCFYCFDLLFESALTIIIKYFII